MHTHTFTCTLAEMPIGCPGENNLNSKTQLKYRLLSIFLRNTTNKK